jgi:hypothetical protein
MVRLFREFVSEGCIIGHRQQAKLRDINSLDILKALEVIGPKKVTVLLPSESCTVKPRDILCRVPEKERWIRENYICGEPYIKICFFRDN